MWGREKKAKTIRERILVTARIRIGNQTAISCADALEPFHFALRHGFDAFEWFADKKEYADGRVAGWDESDFGTAQRTWIRSVGAAADVRCSVHAPWQANPLCADGIALLIRSIDFARDIGAELVNLHLYVEEGPDGYAQGARTRVASRRRLGPTYQHREHAAHDAGRFQRHLRLFGPAPSPRPASSARASTWATPICAPTRTTILFAFWTNSTLPFRLFTFTLTKIKATAIAT